MDSSVLAITVKLSSYRQRANSNGIFAIFLNETGNTMNRQMKVFETPQDMVNYIQNIPCDSIVIMGTMGTPCSIINNDSVKRAIMTVGSGLINILQPEQSWALVGVKGSAPGKAKETTDADLSCDMPTTKKKFTTTISAISTLNYAEISVEGTAYKTVEEESLLVVVLDENSLEKLLHKEYNRESLNDFVENISSLEYGKIVAVALNGNLHLTDEVIETCEIIGSSKSEQIEEGKPWTIISYKGADQDCVVEVLSEADQPAECLALLPVDPLCCDGVNIISSTSTDSMPDSAFVSIGGIAVSESPLSQEERGIGLIVIEPSSGAFEEEKKFNIHDSEEEASNLVQFVQNIPVGKIVAGFLHGKGDYKYLTDKAKRVLQQIGSTKIWEVSENSSWAIVGRKGCAPGSLPEIHRKDGVVAVQLTCQFMTCLFARPFYSLYATSEGMACGSSASIRMENSFILKADETNSGLHVAVLDSENYDLQHLDCFDTSSGKSKSEEFAKFIAKQSPGSIIVVVVSKEASQNLTDSAKEIIVSLGSKQIHELRDGGSWCLISAKDCPGVYVEALSNTTTAHCHMCLPIWGVNINQTYTLIKAQSQKDLGEIAIGSKVQSSNFPNTITLATVDPILWQIEDAHVFFRNEDCVQKLESMLSKVQSGKLVVAAGCGDISKHFTEQSMHVIESIGSSFVESISKDSSWALIGIKGAAPGSVCESIESNAVVSLCVTCPESTKKKNTDTSSEAENKSSGGSTKPPSSGSSGISSGKTFSDKVPKTAIRSRKTRTKLTSGSSSQVLRKVLLAGTGITFEDKEEEDKDKEKKGKVKVHPTLFTIGANFRNIYGLEDEDLTILLDIDEIPKGKWPSKKTIIKKLEEYRELAKSNSSSVFLFYFFGHGREDRIIALNDDDGDYPDEIKREELMKLLDDFPKDSNITFVIHSCRSGGMFEGLSHPGFAFTSCSALVECSMTKDSTNRKDFTNQFRTALLKNKECKLSYTNMHEELKKLVKENESHQMVLSRLLVPSCFPHFMTLYTITEGIITETIQELRNKDTNKNIEVMLLLRKVNEAYETSATEIIGSQCYLTAKKNLFGKRFRLKYLEAVKNTDLAADIIGVATFTYEDQESFPEGIINILQTLSLEFWTETKGEVVINQIVLVLAKLDFDSYESTPKMFWNGEINDPNTQCFFQPRSP